LGLSGLRNKETKIGAACQVMARLKAINLLRFCRRPAPKGAFDPWRSCLDAGSSADYLVTIQQCQLVKRFAPQKYLQANEGLGHRPASA
jgi:hypothetical protein